MVDQLAALLKNIKAEIIEPVVIKGKPKQQDIELLEKLADKIAEKHKELKIM